MYIKLQQITFSGLVVFILLLNQHLFSGDTYVYTPEGRPVPADINQEMSSEQIAECHRYIQEEWIEPEGLNAVRIGDASNKYNCHGYAWSLSEGNKKVWIGTDEDPDVETYYWTDGAWSNDGQPSYFSSSESAAAHAWYSDPGDDHSVRKIQNSYPCTISGGRDYVSKWGYYGLYQHAKGHDIYKLKSTSGFAFKKLKTTHYGTLTNYSKTWVGAGSKTHTLTSNVTVPAGINLYIKSGATINTNGHTLFTNGGDIIGDNKNNSIINGTVSLEYANYCAIRNLTVNDEIHVNSGHHNEISNVITEERIVWNNCSYGHILAVTANHGDKYGIKIYQSYDVFIDHFISMESSKYGIYGNHYSYLDLWTQSGYNNQITDKTYALQITDHSTADLLYTYFCDNSYDIWTASGPVGETDAVAYYCIWSGDPNNTTYGDVYFYPSSNWQQCNSMALSKKSGSVELSSVNYENHNSGSGNVDFDEAIKIFKDLRKQSKSDDSFIKEEHTQEYQNAIDKFKKVISEYPGDPIAISALVYMSWSYKEINQPVVFKAYLEFLVKDKKYSGELKYHAKMLMASQNIHNREYDLALNQYDSVIEDCSTPDILVEAFYGKGILYLYYHKDNEKAAAVFKELIEKYPDHPTAEAAMDELENMDEGFVVNANESLPSELTIQNYPNPFNLETQIRFRNFETTFVNVSIYNSMGQLIKKLVNKSLPEGLHTVAWNGKNDAGNVVASGLYFCCLKTNKNVVTQKLLLVK